MSCFINSWLKFIHINSSAYRASKQMAKLQATIEKLRKNELKLHAILAFEKIGEWELNLQDMTSWQSPLHSEIYGYDGPVPDWGFNRFLSHVLDEDRAEVERTVHTALAAQVDFEFECRIRRVDNVVRWIKVHGQHYADADDNRSVLGIVRDITEHKLADINLQRLTQLYAALSQCNQSIVHCSDEKQLFAEVCRDAVNFGGMTMVWIGMIDPLNKFIKPVASFGVGVEYLDGFEIPLDQDRSAWRSLTSRAIRDNKPVWCMDFQNDECTAVWRERGKQYGWNSLGVLPLCRHDVPVGALVVNSIHINFFDEAIRKLLIEMAMDISFALDRFANEAVRQQTELALQSSNAYLQLIIDTEPDCVKIVNPLGELVEMNRAGLAMLEAETLGEVKGHRLQNFIMPEYRKAFLALHKRVMQGKTAKLVFEVTGLKGGRRWLETHAVPMRDAAGKITALLGITRDITSHKVAEDRINYLANFDALTGLPNRHKMDEQLDYALKLAKRDNGKLAIMFIDIDHFKDINDTLGHQVGDTVLLEFAKRIRNSLRGEDTVSRLGGDEFILMLPGNDASGAAQVAQNLLQVAAAPYQNGVHDLSVTASIGIALYPEDGSTIEILSRNADTAMYLAKSDGRNAYRFFTPEMQAKAMRNAQVLSALRLALSKNQFEIYYQPQLTIQHSRVIGAEALLRWQHPELGSVSPAEFIPVAENNGLILAIGEWVLRNAMQQLKQWKDQGRTDLVIAVNLSAIQLRHPNLISMLQSIMEETGLPQSSLELELTESMAMHNPQDAVEVIRRLNDIGIGVSIDDFGTGYSSLSYLKRFKAYKLKIDQSFIRDITTDAEDRAIVAAIISMAKSLELQTIAEGVETAEQLAYLREQGCDEVQGYYFSKPLPAAQFEAFMANHAATI